MRQLVYTMFISNNRPSFHLWWKEKFSKTSQSLKIFYNWLQAVTTALVQTTNNQPASQLNAPISTHTNQNWFSLNISKYYVMKIFKGACFEKKFWKTRAWFLFIYFEKNKKTFYMLIYYFYIFQKDRKIFFMLTFSFFKNSSLFINSNDF